jgi:hypothetical protein
MHNEPDDLHVEVQEFLDKVTHSTAAVMRNRTLQSEPGYEPTDCDRYDYHWLRLVLTKDLDVSHCEMLGVPPQSSQRLRCTVEVQLKR